VGPESEGYPLRMSSVKDTKIGGHDGIFTRVDAQTLKKQVVSEEFSFYRQLSSQNTCLVPFVPKVETSIEDGRKYVLMEDLASGFSRPCILDLKMGVSTATGATGPKLLRRMHRDMETTTPSLGMRIIGMRIWDDKQEKYWLVFCTQR